MVVQREDGFDVFPLPGLWCDTRTTLVLRVSEKKIHQSKSLGVHDRFLFENLVNVLFGGLDSNPVEPVLDTFAVNPGLQVFLRCDLDEYQDGCMVDTAANF